MCYEEIEYQIEVVHYSVVSRVCGRRVRGGEAETR